MATQADYLRALQDGGPMPVTQMFATVYPRMVEKPQGCSNWSLDRLVQTDKVRVVRIQGSWNANYTEYTHHSDPLRSRARTWVMLRQDCERLMDIGVIQASEGHTPWWPNPTKTRYELVAGRSFSACQICGGHETEGLRRTKMHGVVHKECETK